MIYLHVPFCKSFCAYCDFYSEVCPASESERAQKLFANGVCAEIDARRDDLAAANTPRTLYVGGGTPSLLEPAQLERIVAHLDGGPYEEFTLEVNPEDIVERGEAYVGALLQLGVNRISMGVQSLDDGILRWMRRRHDSARAREAIRILRGAGVSNLSLDLIFGISTLTDAQWAETLGEVLQLRPEHLSAYQLSIEPGSELGRQVKRGEYREATQEQCRRQYDILCQAAARAGYRHYEISNFALPGYEAVHNSAYWRRAPYVGLGPGAHSFDGRRVRSWNSEALTGWTREGETLSGQDEVTETLMLGLRTAEGLSGSWLSAHADPAALRSLLGQGALVRDGERIRIPEDHFFVSDEIIRELA